MAKVQATLRAAGWAVLAAITLCSVSGADATVNPALSESIRERLRMCATCHGEGGNSQTAGIPSVAGQPKTFLETQLILFREGLRVSPPMQPVTKGLSDREISLLAESFAASPVRVEPAEADPALEKRGREVARKLRCGTCHLPDFRGRAQIPRLAGQREEYLVDAMTALRDKRRSGADTIMSGVLHGVSDADIGAMAHFLSRLR